MNKKITRFFFVGESELLKPNMENIILPSSEMVKDYMDYSYINSLLVGVKITLTLFPIALLILLVIYIKSRIEKKK